MKKKVNINGVEVTTNCGSNYSIDSGNGRKTMSMHFQEWNESDEQTLKRLAEKGYTKIMFFLTTTAVKGYYHKIVYCKR